MVNLNLNKLAEKAYKTAKEHGFHDERKTDGHYIMLVACELAEAVEADRCGKRANREEYERLSGVYEKQLRPNLFEMYIKDTIEDELADAVIRLLDYVKMKGYKIPDGYINMKSIKEEADEAFLSGGWNKLKSFAERVFVSCVVNLESAIELPETAIYSIFVLAELYKIDLYWHITQKMKYNETRERLHGKTY